MEVLCDVCMTARHVFVKDEILVCIFGSWKKRQTISRCVDKQLLIVSDSQPTHFDVFVVTESRRSVSQTSEVVTHNVMFHHNCFSHSSLFCAFFWFLQGYIVLDFIS